MRRRKIHGIGWLYLAVAIAIVRLFSGSWHVDGGWLLVFVFMLLAASTYVTRTGIESIEEIEERIDAELEENR